jgi:hypothetical protein
MMPIGANCSWPRGRRDWRQRTLLFVDRDTDKEHYDQGYGLMFGAADLDASHNRFSTAPPFTSTAREVGLCVDSGQARNKLGPKWRR